MREGDVHDGDAHADDAPRGTRRPASVSMRRASAIGCVLGVGCVTPAVPTGAIDAACSPPTFSARACDAPTSVDPETISDRDAFLVAASAILCDRVLGVPPSPPAPTGPSATAFCLPGFAPLYLQQAIPVGTTYDVQAGRACLRALVAAPGPESALTTWENCLRVVEGAIGRPCGDTAPPGTYCWFGSTCIDGTCQFTPTHEACTPTDPGTCQPSDYCSGVGCRPIPNVGTPCEPVSWCGDFVCIGGSCARGGALGARCDASSPCDPSLVCNTGACAVQPGAAGDCCGADADCTSGACDDGRCASVGHFGCACRVDGQCPAEVSRCIDGTCTPRPLLGEPCTADGASCLGATCDVASGRCALGPTCEADADCAAGRVCATVEWRTGHTCEPRPLLGRDCVPGDAPCLDSVCDPSALRCHLGADGEWPCEADGDCQPGLRCLLGLGFGICTSS